MAWKFGTVETVGAVSAVALTVPISASTVQSFVVHILASATNGNSGVFVHTGAVSRDSTTSTSLVGAVDTLNFRDVVAWTSVPTISSTNLIVTVTGSAGLTVRWTPIKCEILTLSAPPPVA